MVEIHQDAKDGLKSAERAERVRKQAEGIPGKFRGVYLAASDGNASPRQAIKAKCQECVGWEDVSERIGRCSAYSCSLWAYRPFQPK